MKLRLLIAVAMLCAISGAQVQVAPILQPHQTFVDQSGAPCSGCTLTSYIAGTTTPTPTYTDSTGVSQNTNPIILSVQGGANIWVNSSQSYKFVLKNFLGATIWTVDNVESPGNTAGLIVSAPVGTQTITQPSGTDLRVVTSGGGKFKYNGSEVITAATLGSSAVLTNPIADQTVTQPDGTTLNISGAFSATSTNGVINVNNYPGATVSDKVLAAQTACPSTEDGPGCYLVLPLGMMAGDTPPNTSLLPNTILEDQRFLNGSAPFFGFLEGTHSWHNYTQIVGPLQPWEDTESFTGPTILSINAKALPDAGLPSPNGRGELIPFLINSGRLAGSNRFVEGADINIGIGSLTNDANGLEIDCNNQSGADDTDSHMHCLQLIAGDANRPAVALQITALGGMYGWWLRGEDVTRYHDIGINMDGADPDAIADILIHPPDDNAGKATIQQFNNARTVSVFSVTRTGAVHTTNLNAERISGAGLQVTSTTGCSYAAGTVGQSCMVTVVPLTPLANGNYTPVCSVIDGTGGANYIGNVHIIDGGSFQVFEAAGSNVSTGGGTIRCIVGNN